MFDRYGAHIDRNNKEQSFRKVIKSLDLQDFHDFLKSDEGTNLDLFVDGCLSRSPKPMAAPTA